MSLDLFDNPWRYAFNCNSAMWTGGRCGDSGQGLCQAWSETACAYVDRGRFGVCVHIKQAGSQHTWMRDYVACIPIIQALTLCPLLNRRKFAHPKMSVRGTSAYLFSIFSPSGEVADTSPAFPMRVAIILIQLAWPTSYGECIITPSTTMPPASVRERSVPLPLTAWAGWALW